VNASRATFFHATRSAAILATSVLFTGCTTVLSTSPIGASTTGAAVGIPYSLPGLRAGVTITRTLSDCAVAPIKDTDKKTGKPITLNKISAEFEVKSEIKTSYVEGETFIADYRSLSNWTKTSSLKIETFDNKTLKSVNASASDKSPQILGGLVKAGFSIARLATGLPTVAAGDLGGAPAVQEPACPAALGQQQDLLKASKALTKELKDLNSQLDPYVVPALIGTLTEKDKEKISAIRAKMMENTSKQKAIEEKTADLAKKLQFTEVAEFVPTQEKLDYTVDFPSGKPDLSKAQMEWLKGLFGVEPKGVFWADIKAKMKWLTMIARVNSGGGATNGICTGLGLSATCATHAAPVWANGSLPPSVPGLVFRSPVNTILRICHGGNAADCENGNAPAVVELDAATPQLGRLNVLPFQNGFGADNKLEAHFRADGSLEWASYDQTQAPGVGAVNTLNDALGQTAAIIKDQADKDKAAEDAAKNAPAADLDQQIALLTKQKQLGEIQASLDGDSQTQAKEQAALDAKITRLEALKKIKDLEAQLVQ